MNRARGAAWPRRADPITGPDAGPGRVLPVPASGRRARPGRWMRAEKERPRRAAAASAAGGGGAIPTVAVSPPPVKRFRHGNVFATADVCVVSQAERAFVSDERLGAEARSPCSGQNWQRG